MRENYVDRIAEPNIAYSCDAFVKIFTEPYTRHLYTNYLGISTEPYVRCLCANMFKNLRKFTSVFIIPVRINIYRTPLFSPCAKFVVRFTHKNPQAK